MITKKVRMLYSQYKQHYPDCQTVRGSYDEGKKTIEVIIPEGRMKNSGVRGQHFHGYEIYCIDDKGRKVFVTYRAVSDDNALKQHKKFCKDNNYEYLEEFGRIYL